MVETEQKNVPYLRFPEFSGKWNSVKLGEIATFSKGKGISKSDIDKNGQLSCIRYGELYTSYGEIISHTLSKTNVSIDSLLLSEAGDVIIPASGETQIDIATASCVLQAGIALGGDLNIIKSNLNGIFLSYYMNSKLKHQIARLAQGIAVVHIYGHHLSKLKLNTTQKDEQKKITDFLISIDEKIKKLSQKKELLDKYKKGVMQKLFSQHTRFTDDVSRNYPDWEEFFLGNLNVVIADGNYGEMYPKADQMLKSGVPFIRANNMKNLKIIWKDMKFISEELHSILQSGHLEYKDILVTTRGDIGILAFVSEDFKNSNINAQICLLRCAKGISSIYLINYLSSYYCQKQFKQLQTGSALKQLPKGNLVKILIKLPHIDEQHKIANFFTVIDDKINHVSQQLDQTKQFKKGLLQQMFI